MNRRKIKNKSDEARLNDVITALAADYDRRKRAITEDRLPRRVLMEYAYINTRMLAAAGEVVGLAFAEAFIREIGENVGFIASEVNFMCESSYKISKRKIKQNIAKKLYLL